MIDEKKIATQGETNSTSADSVQESPELNEPSNESSEGNQKIYVAEMAKAFLNDDSDEEKKSKSAEVESAEVESTEVESAIELKKESEKENHVEALQEIEKTDFSTLNKEELLKIIAEIAQKHTLSVHGKTLGGIKETFDVFANQEKEEALLKFIESGGEKEGFYLKGNETTSKFYEYSNLIKNNRHKHFKEKEKEKDNNLKLKNALLEKLRETVDREESTASMTSLKEIQTGWRSIGSVPPQQNRTLWANYHALIDRFYDHRSIYFELKELDRKKNLENKNEICQKAEELDKLENFKDAIQKLNELHEEFKHVGPIPKESEDEIWDRFKTASDLIYSKRKEFVSHIKDEQKENLEKKKSLATSITAYANYTSDKISEWNSKTKEILDFQKQWEKTGAMPRESAKQINKEFWVSFKSFFNNKSEFFKSLESEREDNLNIKKELIAQAESLLDSTDWQKTTEILKDLQIKWSEIGPVPEKYRNSIYKLFKDACDGFFNNRRKHNQGLDSEYLDNLNKKEEIFATLEKMSEAKDVNMDEVYALQDSFSAIGFVPRKNIKSIQKRYQEALNKLVKSADNLDKDSKSEFKSLIEIHELKSGPNADQKLDRREHSLRRKISALESDVSIWKNNIGFFSSSKNADELLKGFEVKIVDAEKEIRNLKDELKLIINA